MPPSILKLGPLPPNTFRPPHGQKQIFLPNFTLTLLRTPHSPPHWASFITPLWLNKLDLKDYLYHAYGLQVLGVRSYVLQAKIQHSGDDPDARKRGRFRSRATKKMTVELAEKGEGQGAFVWPEEPEDYSPWGQAAIAEASQGQNSGRQNDMMSNVKKQKRKIGGPRGMKDRRGGETIAQQARKLLRGEESWGPGWRDYGVGVGRGGVRGVDRDMDRDGEGGG